VEEIFVLYCDPGNVEYTANATSAHNFRATSEGAENEPSVGLGQREGRHVFLIVPFGAAANEW
jgi:hypothetical protein